MAGARPCPETFTMAELTRRRGNGNGTVALKTLSCALALGERIALVGPSGAGKFTLLRLLAASLKPSSGKLSCSAPRRGCRAAGAAQAARAHRHGSSERRDRAAPAKVVTAVLAGRLGAGHGGRGGGCIRSTRPARNANWPGSISVGGCSSAAIASRAGSCSVWRLPACSISSPT